ncbi:MAG: hypothetical protein ACRCUC_05490, partial [Aestuariivirga sp.]
MAQQVLLTIRHGTGAGVAHAHALEHVPGALDAPVAFARKPSRILGGFEFGALLGRDSGPFVDLLAALALGLCQLDAGGTLENLHAGLVAVAADTGQDVAQSVGVLVLDVLDDTGNPVVAALPDVDAVLVEDGARHIVQ